jgi:hypothetical protein
VTEKTISFEQGFALRRGLRSREALQRALTL